MIVNALLTAESPEEAVDVFFTREDAEAALVACLRESARGILSCDLPATLRRLIALTTPRSGETIAQLKGTKGDLE
jgi:hypothetical protein